MSTVREYAAERMATLRRLREQGKLTFEEVAILGTYYRDEVREVEGTAIHEYIPGEGIGLDHIDGMGRNPE